MKKSKEILSASINTEVKSRFDIFCADRQINKSRLVEWLIEQHIEQFKILVDQEGLKK